MSSPLVEAWLCLMTVSASAVNTLPALYATSSHRRSGGLVAVPARCNVTDAPCRDASDPQLSSRWYHGTPGTHQAWRRASCRSLPLIRELWSRLGEYFPDFLLFFQLSPAIRGPGANDNNPAGPHIS